MVIPAVPSRLFFSGSSVPRRLSAGTRWVHCAAAWQASATRDNRITSWGHGRTPVVKDSWSMWV